MASPAEGEDDQPFPSFRPLKRRKFYRKRADGDNDDNIGESSAGPVPSPPTNNASALSPPPQTLDDLISSAQEAGTTSLSADLSPESSLSDLLRQRKAQQRKRHGLEFRAEKANAGGSKVNADAEEKGLQLATRDGRRTEDKLAALEEVNSRFSRQAGPAVSMDKHMMAYIDAHLSSRLDPPQTTHPSTSRRTPGSSSPSDDNDDSSSHDESSASKPLDPPPSATKPSTSSTAAAHAQRQPASMGKLLEIDLPAREEGQGTAGDSRVPGSNNSPKARRKPRPRRLGRDGKPLPERPSRRWNRRGSDDMRRDALVEELLRENRIEMYEEGPNGGGSAVGGEARAGGEGAGGSGGTAGNDLAADERMAAEFRAEFMDALQARRQVAQGQKAASAGAAGAKGKEEEKLKGPKLGGSRSQRAVLREKELEAQRERERGKGVRR